MLCNSSPDLALIGCQRFIVEVAWNRSESLIVLRLNHPPVDEKLGVTSPPEIALNLLHPQDDSSLKKFGYLRDFYSDADWNLGEKVGAGAQLYAPCQFSRGLTIWEH
jgi:hypothetical protein